MHDLWNIHMFMVCTHIVHIKELKEWKSHHQPDEDKWMDCVTCPEETGLTAADFRWYEIGEGVATITSSHRSHGGLKFDHHLYCHQLSISSKATPLAYKHHHQLVQCGAVWCEGRQKQREKTNWVESKDKTKSKEKTKRKDKQKSKQNICTFAWERWVLC